MNRANLYVASGADTGNTTIGRGRTTTDHTKILAEIFAELAEQVGWQRGVTRDLIEDGQRIYEHAGRFEDQLYARLLSVKTSEKKQAEVTSLLLGLSDLGFSWSDLARIFGVSIPGLRKWRLGEPPTPNNRVKVAALAALCELLREKNPLIEDVAAWLEMPLVNGVPITGIDLLAHGRSDLVIRYVIDDDADAILDTFDPDWRKDFDSTVVVVEGPDGLPALTLDHER
jgi:hypothetical protein